MASAEIIVSVSKPVPSPTKHLPRGVITPPPAVLERLEQERSKHQSEIFAKSEQSLLNDWTVATSSIRSV